jgi:hypothetical protein
MVRVCKINSSGNRRTLWRVCVSVLLIGLVLYNPFFALRIHSSGLAYSSLARHRSTVGSSEMQHFSPEQSEYTQPDATVVQLSPDISVVKNEYPAKDILDQALPRQPELIASICFRPPPSL